jgi:hypothetical protein
MTVGKKRPDPKLAAFPFVRTKEMVATSGLSADSLKQLRTTVLTESIYWFRPPGTTRILWNAVLVRDFLIRGTSQHHSQAVENFLKTLPSTQV